VKKFLTLLSTFAFVALLPCIATQAASLADATKAFEKKVGAKPESVRKTEVPGIYEAIVRKKIFYFTENANYLFVGHIFDTEKKTDLTAARLVDLSRVRWDTLPLKDAIKVVYGNGKAKIAVITDTNCTFCRLLEQSIRQVGNVTVYNFLHPTPRSRELSRRVFCAKDNAKAFREYMIDGKEPDATEGKCDSSALDRNLAFGRKLGISGTPFIIFSDGETHPGSLAAADLQEKLTHKK
jgi:thiol:disulfide interchange protein DsbC